MWLERSTDIGDIGAENDVCVVRSEIGQLPGPRKRKSKRVVIEVKVRRR